MKKTVKIMLFMSLLPVMLTGCKDKSEDAGETVSQTETGTEAVTEAKQTYYNYQVTETVYQHDDGRRIYGQFYVPDSEDETYPTMIMSHGLGGTHEDSVKYAETLAERGYACYIYDFCGGSVNSASDGSMQEMSVMTEKDDLNVVLDAVKKESFVDTDHIFLLGGSQGGLVSALVADDRPDEIAGMVLLFPAFVIPDYARELYKSIDGLPDNVNAFGLAVGKKYIEDVIDMDVYEEIKNYKKDVLIIHGTNDYVVPISYSQKAVEVYDSAELMEIEGAEHGFRDLKSTTLTEKYTLEYLKKVLE